MKKTRKILVCLLAMVFCFTSLGITAFADVTPANVVGTSEAGIATIADGSTLATVVAPAPAQPKLTKAQKAKLNKIKKLTAPKMGKVVAGEEYGQVVVKVKSKVKNATGYEFYKSTKQKSGFKKVATVKNATSVTVNNLNGTYYFKVRAYLKKPNGKTIYSKYSAVKKVTAQVQVAKATYSKTLDVSELLKDVSLTEVASNPETIKAKFQNINLKKVGGAAFSTANFSYSKTAGANNHWQYMLRAKDAVNAENLAVVTEKIAKNPNVNTDEFMQIFEEFVGVDIIADKVKVKVTEKLKEADIDLSTLKNQIESGSTLNMLEISAVLSSVNTLRADLEKKKILQYKKGVNKNPLNPFAGLMIGIPQTIEYLGGLDSLLAETSSVADLYKESEYLTTYKNLQRGDMLLCEGADKNVAIVVLGYVVK